MTLDTNRRTKGERSTPGRLELSVLPSRGRDLRDSVTRRLEKLRAQERKVLRESLISLACGQTPTAPELAAVLGLAKGRVREALRALEALDFVALEGDEVRVAYPFTTGEVPHEVVSSRGVSRTCCAVDALGVGSMLGETIEVRSRCSHCGAPVRLRGKDRLVGTPEGAIVFIPAVEFVEGRAIEAICPSINFYCNAEHGRAQLGGAADRGRFVSLDEAAAMGTAIFGGLLDGLR